MPRPSRHISRMLCALLAAACACEGSGGQGPAGTSTAMTGTSSSSSATGAADSAPTTAALTGSGGGSTGAVCGFLDCDDYPKPECDQWAQDCPEGQKCAPTISDGGGVWDAVKCVEVTGTDLPGEPCTMDDVASGVDSCVKGAMCWSVENGMGYCVAQCIGSPESPVCEKGVNCLTDAQGTLALCIPNCDPLVQDCPVPGQACYPINNGLYCAPDGSGDEGQANDPCEFINVCDPGLMCADADMVGAGCPAGSSGCCTPFCKFPGGACPNPDQQCVQYFDPKQLDPGDPQLAIGYCGVPV